MAFLELPAYYGLGDPFPSQKDRLAEAEFSRPERVFDIVFVVSISCVVLVQLTVWMIVHAVAPAAFID